MQSLIPFVSNNLKETQSTLFTLSGLGVAKLTVSHKTVSQAYTPAERSNNYVGNKAFSSTDPPSTLFQQPNEYFNA